MGYRFPRQHLRLSLLGLTNRNHVDIPPVAALEIRCTGCAGNHHLCLGFAEFVHPRAGRVVTKRVDVEVFGAGADHRRSTRKVSGIRPSTPYGCTGTVGRLHDSPADLNAIGKHHEFPVRIRSKLHIFVVPMLQHFQRPAGKRRSAKGHGADVPEVAAAVVGRP